MFSDQAPAERHPRRTLTWPIAAVCVLALGVVASCDRMPTAPRLSLDASPLRSLGGGSFTLGVLPTTSENYGSEGWKNTGIQTLTGMLYVIRVTGSVTASPNTQLGCFGSINWSTVPDMGAYGPGEPAPRDSATGYLGVTIRVDSLAGWDIALKKTADGTAWESDPLPLSTGTLWARRNNGPPAGTSCAGSPPGGGFYALSGTSTIQITERCPPTNDPVLDNVPFRKYLRAQLDTSLMQFSTERSGTILQVDGVVPPAYDFYYETHPGATQCMNSMSIRVSQGYTVVGTWHTHALVPGTSFGWCPTAEPDAAPGKVPSDSDYVSQEKTKYPMYIIDLDDIIRVGNHTDTTLTGRDNATTYHNWSRCPAFFN